MSYLKSLQIIGVTARIKRISDTLMHDARRVYEYLELPIEPNWHLIFLLLKEKGQLSVTEISKALEFSHPSVITIIKKMKKVGYVTSRVHTKDSRKQIIELTEKAHKELPKLQAEWDQIKIAVRDIFDNEFLGQLEIVEEKMEQKGLLSRVIEIKTNTNDQN
ncbi:MarR family transcriptional regulator [Flagellimonas sp. 389]|uniref:MarR family winged helix-turn-helix transcriptional regulator n=1 Tax=Flagellimonas sp. 389 TaxID=2835862 RepID=UPI001BD4091E|nr:MarR family transcriptional regulator [Flagellimonas sp. 389]MBS9462906.1 MarR family transcriptional regulator [Flagellimonas sp. 389]